MLRKLSQRQQDVYESLVQHGSWRMYGIGWVWDTPYGTKRTMDQLVANGYADLRDETYYPVIPVAEGRWLPTATVANTPGGAIEWHNLPRRGYTAMVGNRCIGKVRWLPAAKQWNATLEGWMWAVTPDMPAARFNVKESPVKDFKSRKDAQRAIERAWAIPRHAV